MLLALGLVIGMTGGAGAVLYLVEKNKSADAGDILMSQKVFLDNETYLIVYGTVAGLAQYPNNSATIICYRERKKCSTTFVRQTGPNTLSPVAVPAEYDIAEWTSSELTASSSGTLGCVRTTITIKQKTEEVLWVDEPVNLNQPQCGDADRQVRKYTIEDSPGWKKMLGKPALQQ